LPAGLPAAPRHAVRRLRGVCGGSGGHGVGEDVPPRLLRVHRLQVNVNIKKSVVCFESTSCAVGLQVRLLLCSSDSLSLRGIASPSGGRSASASAAAAPRLRPPTTSLVPAVSSLCAFNPKSCFIKALEQNLDPVQTCGHTQRVMHIGQMWPQH